MKESISKKGKKWWQKRIRTNQAKVRRNIKSERSQRKDQMATDTHINGVLVGP